MKRFALIVTLLFVLASGAVADVPSGWATNFTAALAEAKTKQQPVLAYFTASWCGPCKLMARTTLTNDAVLHTLTRFSQVAVDIDEQHELAEKYSVNAVPTFRLLTAAGDEVTATTGYQDAARFLQFLTNGVSEVQETMARQQRFKESLAQVEELLKKSDVDSLRKAATELFNLAAERDEANQKVVSDHFAALAKRDPRVLLDGLNHARLATRIRVANALRAQLGDAFQVDVWSDAGSRRKAVDQLRAKFAAK